MNPERFTILLFLVPAVVGLCGVLFFGWDPYAGEWSDLP